MARRLCPRFGMTAEETETVAWLVRWHLLMSYAAFKRDINDPKTIEDFTAIVRSPERLRLLLVLTVADIEQLGQMFGIVGKTLLSELYWLAEEALLGIALLKHKQLGLKKFMTIWKRTSLDFQRTPYSFQARLPFILADV